jgi:CHASE3 domain sensor protein
MSPGRLVAVAAPLLATAILVNAYFALSESRRWELHTYEILHAVSAATEALDQAVLRQQSFVLTGDETVLGGFHAALQRLVPAMASIAELTVQDPRQRTVLAGARPLIDTGLGLLAAGVMRTQAMGVDLEAARIRAAAIEAQFSRVRGVFDALADEQRRLLAERGEASARAERGLAVGAVLTGLCALASFYVVVSGRRRTDRAEDRRA